MGADQEWGERAGADHDHPARVLAGEMARGKRGGRGGPPQRQAGPVHGGEGLAGRAVQEEIGAEHAR
jgi:hypothetical protein